MNDNENVVPKEFERAFFEFLGSEGNKGLLRNMIKDQKNRFIVNIDELRQESPQFVEYFNGKSSYNYSNDVAARCKCGF